MTSPITDENLNVQGSRPPPAILNTGMIIKANNQWLHSFQEFSITRSLEQVPSSFVVQYSNRSQGGEVIGELAENDAVEVWLGNTRLLTGVIDSREIRQSVNSHDFRIQGRSAMRNIIDCSADVAGGTMSVSSLNQLCTILCNPFGVKVVDYSDADKHVIQPFMVNLGESPWDIIERIARYQGKLIYDDEKGQLVIDEVGSTHQRGSLDTTNTTARAVAFRCDQRFSEYQVFWQPLDLSGASVSGSSKPQGIAYDPQKAQLGFRPLKIINASNNLDGTFSQQLAQFTANRAWGRSRALDVTVSGWTDAHGSIWQVNKLVDIDYPDLGIKETWLIAGVTFNKRTNETSTTLQVMPSAAFSIEPIVLNSSAADLSANTTVPDASVAPAQQNTATPTVRLGST